MLPTNLTGLQLTNNDLTGNLSSIGPETPNLGEPCHLAVVAKSC